MLDGMPGWGRLLELLHGRRGAFWELLLPFVFTFVSLSSLPVHFRHFCFPFFAFVSLWLLLFHFGQFWLTLVNFG
jgi:hypothetical protein